MIFEKSAKERESHRKKKPTRTKHTLRKRERTIGVDRNRDQRNCADRDLTIEIDEITIAISSISREASIAIAIDASRDLTIEIGEIVIAISPRKCDLFWVLFVFLGMNDIMYSFGNWENVRKCEQQVENVFSMVFSRTQPNIRKYFPKHFLKCNQTHENIFLFRKIAFLKNIYFLEILLHEPNAALVFTFFCFYS